MQRSQIRRQIRSIFTIQSNLVGAKLQLFNIHDLMMRNAICFIWARILLPQAALGFSFRTRHEVPSKNKDNVPHDLDRCTLQQLVTEVIETGNDKAVDRD